MISALLIVLVGGIAFYAGYRIGARDALNAAEWVWINVANAEEALEKKFSVGD